MDTPNEEVYVVVANYSDGSGGPEILGVFCYEDSATRLVDIIEKTEPRKNVAVHTSFYWR